MLLTFDLTMLSETFSDKNNKPYSSSKENLKTPGNSKQDDEEESNEPDYDEDKDQLEEAQEEETGETSDATINKVF